MLALLQRIRQAERNSPLGTNEQISTFIVDIIADACERHAALPGIPLGGALYEAIEALLWEDAITGNHTDGSVEICATIEEALRLRADLKRRVSFLESHAQLLSMLRYM